MPDRTQPPGEEVTWTVVVWDDELARRVEAQAAAPEPAELAPEAELRARVALAHIGPRGQIGQRLGAFREGATGVAVHFAAEEPGYAGWFWNVSMSRPTLDDELTVSETELLPGPDALLAPAWMPWVERLAMFRATHDRHGNLIAEGDQEEAPSEHAEAEPRIRRRTTVRTRRRRRLDREGNEHEVDSAADALAVDAPAQDGADSAGDDTASVDTSAISLIEQEVD